MGCDIDTSLRCGCDFYGGHDWSCPKSYNHDLYLAGFDRTSSIDGQTYCRGCGAVIVRPDLHAEACDALKELVGND